MDEKSSPEWLNNLPTRSEDIGFAREEMLSCDACGKPNAPNRSACLYCGAALAGATPRIDVREVESWENGHNLILAGGEIPDIDTVAGKLASTLNADQAAIRSVIESRTRLPIARVESDEVATRVADSFEELGVSTRVVSDAALSGEAVRLRSITFRDDEIALELFNVPQVVTVSRDEVALIFAGAILEGRTEATEKRKRGSTLTLSESQMSSDLPFVDIYSRHDPAGWRIPSSGFDFSCLGDEKSLFAGENLEELRHRLSDFAPAAKVVDDYLSVRSLLEHVWPSDHRRDAFGFQRSGFARKDLASVRTVSNLTQVNKYSRLQWHLL